MKNIVKALLEGKSSEFTKKVRGVLSERQDAIIEDLVIMEGNPLIPTKQQFQKYRKNRVDDVSTINKAIRSGTTLKTKWAVDTIKRLRDEQKASRKRERDITSEEIISEGNPINKIKKNAVEAAMGSKDKTHYFTQDQMKKIRDMINARGSFNGAKYAMKYKSKEIHNARQELKKGVNEELNESKDPYSIPPTRFNMASMGILPIGVMKAKSLGDQIDTLYNVADNPETPKDKSKQILRLIGSIYSKYNLR